jgi:hypothetical protein
MMNHSIGVLRRPRRASPPAARTAAAIITAALALLATACSGSPSATGSSGSSNAGGSATSQSAVGYSHCMRSHGVRNFPDPDSSGAIPKETPQQLGVSNSQYQAATLACRRLLPNSGGPTQAELQQQMNGLRTFALCMRSHGVANWPDPTLDRAGLGEINFILHGTIDVNSPQIISKIHACQHLIPPGTRAGGTPGGVPIR